ncbi:MAG TPA: thioredoxin-like domain-containing protein [Gemmataceae bacterium]|nr:thioredoxin-like domain-containing protein [Gemmataceae bacterium]
MAVLVGVAGAGAGLALRLNRSPGPVLVTAASAASPQTPGQADTTQEDAAASMPRFRAPDFDGGVAWLNSAGPLRLRDLRGKIVLLDFWTLCCINCIHTLPDLAKLEKKYANQLVVVGVHSAKFENEKNSESIRKAILRYEVMHPVVNDANMRIWRRYMVESWPTLVLIDPEGYVVARGSGEGLYEGVDRAVEKLVAIHRKKKTLDEQPLSFKLARAAERGDSPLYFPGKVLADAASRRLFIADSTHHRIVITDLEGKKIAIAGTGEPDKSDGPFDKAGFNDPQGMALRGDTLYVADRKNDLIRALDLKARTVKTIAGTGEQGEERRHGGPALQVGLNSPWDLCLQGSKLYIAMAGHHQIWLLDLEKGEIELYAGNGREDIADGPLSEASFAQPSGLTSDGNTLYVADSEVSAVRAVPLGGKGEVQTLVGRGLFDFGDRDGVGDEARLQHAIGVAFHEGKVYVADTYNSKIKVIDPATRSCKTVLGGKEAGWLTGMLFSEPAGLSFAGDKLYVADTNNHRVRVVDVKNRQIATLKLQGVDPPKALDKEERPSFPHATRMTLPLTKVPADGEVALEVEIKPAAGFKLNPEAKARYVLETLPEGGKPLENKQVAQTSGAFRVAVPVTRLAGKEGLRFSVVYYECGEGTLAICKIKSQIWDVPIKTDATVTERLIRLSGAATARAGGKSR